jgi:hypothetical protein
MRGSTCGSTPGEARGSVASHDETGTAGLADTVANRASRNSGGEKQKC